MASLSWALRLNERAEFGPSWSLGLFCLKTCIYWRKLPRNCCSTCLPGTPASLPGCQVFALLQEQPLVTSPPGSWLLASCPTCLPGVCPAPGAATGHQPPWPGSQAAWHMGLALALALHNLGKSSQKPNLKLEIVLKRKGGPAHSKNCEVHFFLALKRPYD